MLRKKEFIPTELKATLALEKEEKKEARAKIVELEAQMTKATMEAVNPSDDQSRNPPSPLDADLLPQGVLLKSLIRNLKKKVHHLRKKLKKMEDDLQALRENASEVTKEVTYLQNVHMKDSASFAIQKRIFKKEISELKKSASDKSWALTMKIGTLKARLKMTKEKI
ncbi:hypothetical protein COCNU_scaffold000249G000020 [Cocos nucifera]|nr:hypothetical protein [Cocos nucifera]